MNSIKAARRVRRPRPAGRLRRAVRVGPAGASVTLVSIHQPDLLPYSGFWFKMAVSDVFVVARHDQFQKHGYQRRVAMRESWVLPPAGRQAEPGADHRGRGRRRLAGAAGRGDRRPVPRVPALEGPGPGALRADRGVHRRPARCRQPRPDRGGARDARDHHRARVHRPADRLRSAPAGRAGACGRRHVVPQRHRRRGVPRRHRRGRLRRGAGSSCAGRTTARPPATRWSRC